MAFNDAFSPYETDRSGDESGTDSKFVGIRKCVLLATQIEGLRSLFDPAFGNEQFWPGTTGLKAPVLKKYALHKKDVKRWELTLHYFEPDVKKPGVAELYAKVSGKIAKVMRERWRADGGAMRVIEGPCEPRMVNGVDVDAGKVWLPLNKGANIELEPQIEIEIRTAAASMQIPDESARIGKVNDADLPNVCNAKKGTLRFDGTSFNGKMVNREYWHIVYHFTWNPLGWSQILVRRFKPKIVRRAVMDEETGEDVGEGRTVIMVPDDADGDDLELRDLGTGEADFSDINGWLAWT